MPMGLQMRKFRRHQDGQAPSLVGKVRGKVMHLAGRVSAIPPLSSPGLCSEGQHGEGAQGERERLLHFLVKEEGNLTDLTKPTQKFSRKVGREWTEKEGTHINRNNQKAARKKQGGREIRAEEAAKERGAEKEERPEKEAAGGRWVDKEDPRRAAGSGVQAALSPSRRRRLAGEGKERGLTCR